MNSDPAAASALEAGIKRLVLIALALAIPLHLFVDPAAGWRVGILTIVLFGGALIASRRWPSIAPAVLMVLVPLAPALLTWLLGVAALNVFYTGLLAGLFGALLPRIPRDRWALPPWWALLLGTWALTVAIGWPVMIVREAGLRLGTLRDIGALDTWAMLSTPQVESWILYVAITQLVGVLWLDWLFANETQNPTDRGSRIPDPVLGLLTGATIASLVAIYQGTVNIGFLSGGVWPDLRRAAGTLLDANAYGAIAALAGPLAFVAIPALRPRHVRIWQSAALAINWAGAWMSGSRTAFVCGALGTVLLVYELLRVGRRTGEERANMSSLLAGAAALVLVVIALAGAIGPVRRMAAGVDVPFADLWSRGGYGTVATRMLRDYPWTGVGIGSFNWMASDYWRILAHDRLPFDNAQNWWRHQLVELGIVGGLSVIAWSLLIAWIVLTRRTPAEHRVEVATLRGLLIGVGIASLLGVPTQNPIVLLLFFYLVARFANLTNPRPSNPRIPDPRSRIPASAWIAGATIAVLYASGQLVLARGPLKPVTRAEVTNHDYITGTYPGERLPHGSFRWTRKRAAFAVNAPTQHLVLRFHVEHPDIATHPVKVRITTACQTLVDEFLTDTDVNGRAYELPAGQSRIAFDTEVSRTWRPADVGKPDRRDLGLAVEVDFVGTETVVSSQERWIPLQACGPV
jgi:hypothetical protein